jgi:hypothetical protein
LAFFLFQNKKTWARRRRPAAAETLEGFFSLGNAFNLPTELQLGSVLRRAFAETMCLRKE